MKGRIDLSQGRRRLAALQILRPLLGLFGPLASQATADTFGSPLDLSLTYGGGGRGGESSPDSHSWWWGPRYRPLR